MKDELVKILTITKNTLNERLNIKEEKYLENSHKKSFKSVKKGLFKKRAKGLGRLVEDGCLLGNAPLHL
jgi:hypothetical protein